MSETPTITEQTKTLKVTQVKSTIGFNKNQFAVLQSLGLRRIRHTVTIADTPETRGMLLTVRHLVTVDEG